MSGEKPLSLRDRVNPAAAGGWGEAGGDRETKGRRDREENANLATL